MKIISCLVLSLLSLATVKVSADPVKIDPWLARIFVSNDFESGTMSPWFDQSPARVNWRVEQLTSPAEVDSPAPRPPNGTQFLRATRNANLDSGLAVLRSPVFTALPGDKVRFAFWIRSRQPQANNLELYWVESNRENILIGLSQFSSSSNFEWRTASVDLPFNRSTDISLVFYGFCGSNLEDAIALDNIEVGFSEPTTTEPTTTEPTTTEPTTTQPTTTQPTTTITYSVPSTTAKPDCNVVLNTPSGSFSSPNYPSDYDNNLNCNWLIVTEANTHISLTFSAFATETNVDIVTVYDGGSISAPVLGRFSGFSVPSRIESSDNILLITFTSDGSLTITGFFASYTSVSPTTTIRTTPYPTDYTTENAPYNCQDTYLYYSGYFSSPNYPNNYPNNVDCYWYLDTYNSNGIYIAFESFSTEQDYDYVQVYEGWSTSGQLLLTASGFSNSGSVYSWRSNRILIHFHSDGSNIYRGFHAYYGAYPPTTEPPAETTYNWMTTPQWCGGELTASSGELTSPYYPNNYMSNLNCSTLIRVSTGRMIRVTIADFNTELGADYLTVFDASVHGPTPSSPLLLKTSGSSIPASFISTSNQIYVRFTTDDLNSNYRGWRLTYSAI